MRNPDRVARARWHLWVTAFLIMAALGGVLVYLSGASHPFSVPLLPGGRLRIALGVLLLAFLVYVVDRERNLHRLSERLTDERVESTRLATRLQFLSELDRERDTNAALLDGSADGVAVVDAGLRLLRFNDAMHSLTGITAEHALGTYAPAVLSFTAADGSSFDDAAYPLRVVLETGEALTGLELRMSVRGGEERWVSGTFSPIGDDGSVAMVLAVLRDITAMKEMQAMQRDFVSIVSHELRAPLTAIKGFAKTLRHRGSTLDEATRAGFLDTVNDQADRLARLVDDLLQVSRIDARRLKLDLNPLGVVETVEHLVQQFSGRWTRPILIDVPAGVGRVLADRAKLEEILINLIDNAIKYSPAGTDVRVLARDSGCEIEISVEDSGAGISPEDTAKLFQRFQRLSTPATRDVGGTGLGLYIVKGLVEAQGGRVWVESSPGTGSVFSFSLPAAAAAEAALHQAAGA